MSPPIGFLLVSKKDEWEKFPFFLLFLNIEMEDWELLYFISRGSFQLIFLNQESLFCHVEIFRQTGLRDHIMNQNVCFFIVVINRGGGSNPFIKKFVPLLLCSGGHNLQHKMCIKSHFWHEISTLRSS